MSGGYEAVLEDARNRGPVKKAGKGHLICCPLHDDRDPSCSVRIENGRFLAKCHSSNCNGNLLAYFKQFTPDGSLETWRYQNVRGDAVDVRRQPGKGTSCKRNPTGVKGPYFPLDHHKIQPEGTIVIVEGERCRDAIMKHTTFYATCWIGGTKNVLGTNWKCLRGRSVVLWADADDTGREAMTKLADLLDDLDCEVREVVIPDGKPKGWDCADADPKEIEELLKEAKPYESAVSLVTLSSVAPVKPRWLIEDWLPAGCMTLLAGDSDVGKTTLALGIAADLSCNRDTLGGAKVNGSVDTLFVTEEDSLNATIVPRLMAANANLDRLHCLAGFDPSQPEALWPLLKRNPKIGLVIFDPVITVAERFDNTNDAGRVRAALRVINDLCLEFGISVLGIHHLRKGSSGSVKEAVIGSQAWTAVPRSVWSAGWLQHDLKDDEEPTERALIVSKSNLGQHKPGVKFDLASRFVAIDGDNTTDFPAAEWQDTLKLSADVAFRRPSDSRRSSPKKADAKAELWGILNNGSYSTKQLEKQLWEHSPTTIKRAREQLREEGTINGKRQPSGDYIWFLVDHTTELDDLYENAPAPC